MDSHVAHPAGLVATLALLYERNRPSNKEELAASGGEQAGGSSEPSSHGRKADLNQEPAPDTFICNVGKEWEPEPNELIGEPVATKFLTVEALKKVGVAGLYRKGARS